MTDASSSNSATINRRDLLKGAGIGATAAVAGANAQPAQAQTGDPPVAMRSPEFHLLRTGAAPPVPPVEVIALTRMAFGPRPGDLAAFRALGATPEAQLQAYVDQQLDPASIDDSALDARLAAENFYTLDKSHEQIWQDHVVDPNDEYPPPEFSGSDYNWRMLPIDETERAACIRAVYSERQLVEVLADFWHNHFNVYGWDYWIGPAFVHYDRDVIRPNLLGNFREMLEAVAKSPAMLFYLDNDSNTRAGPNENYARELFELHTMGAENYLGVQPQQDVPGYDDEAPIGYVDGDVYEATRCFTGWQVDAGYGSNDTGTFYYEESDHDRFQKIVLGRLLPADQGALQDGYDVLDALASHPGSGRHIARKLCRRFISDDPPDSIVNEAASVFTAQKEAPDQLKQVVRTILLSDEFRTTWGEKIKRPFEAVAGALRATNAEFRTTGTFLWYYDKAGQALYQWSAPNGYPDLKEDWSSTTPMLHRWKMINRIIEGIDGTTVDVLGQTPESLGTPNELADFWIDRILGRPMQDHDRTQIVEFLAQGRNPDYDLPQEQIDERLPRMVALILMSPAFQWR